MHQKRHPAGRRLDKPELQIRKLLRDFIGDQITKTEERHDTRVPKCVIAREIEHFKDRFDTTTRVNTYRKLILLRLVINGEQIGMIERIITFNAAKEDSDRAILFGEANLIDGSADRLKR